MRERTGRAGRTTLCAVALLAVTFSLRETGPDMDELIVIESVAELSYLP